MALTYTGRSTLYIPGHEKPYRYGDTVPISKARAAAMAASSNLHSFEDDGVDVSPPVTAPEPAPKAAPKS